MSIEPTVLADLLGSLLDEGVDALGSTAGAVAAPERRYVAHGAVTWDCEQLTSHLVRLTPKFVDPKLASCTILHVPRIALTLLRCIPTVEAGGLPSATDLDEAYRQLAVDGWAMWKHLTRGVVEGTWPEGVKCKDVSFQALEPLAPSGGYAGWRIEIDVRL